MKIVEKILWKFLETFLYFHNLKNVGPGGVSVGATLPLFQYGPKYICVPTRSCRAENLLSNDIKYVMIG